VNDDVASPVLDPYQSPSDTKGGISVNQDTERALAQRIVEAVTAWEGVQAGPRLFPRAKFHFGRRSLGHLHGGRAAHIPLPRRVRDALIADGRARPHPVMPESGWISFSIEDESDADRAIELFRLAYERAVAQRHRPGS
jgi:hypothetical protein